MIPGGSETLRHIAILALLGSGVFFLLVGTLGLLRLPDVFSRMHATSKSDTLGAGLVLAALVLQYGVRQVSIQLLIVLLFIMITSPAANHIMARAAYKNAQREGNSRIAAERSIAAERKMKQDDHDADA